MRRHIRSSFALRLLAAGIALSLVTIVGISAFLLVSRQQQTLAAALSNADNRATVIQGAGKSSTSPSWTPTRSGSRRCPPRSAARSRRR